MSSKNKVNVRALVSVDMTYLPLSIIETMQCMDDVDDELANVNKLKDELLVNVVTFTGREFTVSMRCMKEQTSAAGTDKTLAEVWTDIAEQWIELINDKRK